MSDNISMTGVETGCKLEDIKEGIRMAIDQRYPMSRDCDRCSVSSLHKCSFCLDEFLKGLIE